MRIVDVHSDVYRLPPSVPWEDATNKVQGLEFIVVDLVTDTGLTGTGFSYTVDIGGTSIAALVRDYLSGLVVGMDPLDYERIWMKLQRQSRRLGAGVNSIAMAAIDVAVWDLIGKIHGQPLFKLLGGMRDTVPAYISEINLAETDTAGDLVRRVEDYLARGYRTVKFKIGRPDIEDDIERIRLLRELIGNEGQLLVDLNQKWSASEALVKAARLDDLGLGWIEEPLLYDDVDAHVALKRAIRTPVALGESLHSRAQFLDYLKAGAVDFVQADVAFVGGLTEWLKIAHLAHVFGKPVAPHFMMELSLHMLCGVPNGFMLENVIGGSLSELGLLEEPIVVTNGIARPPQRPGHGVIFDRAALDAVRLRPEELRQAFAGGSK